MTPKGISVGFISALPDCHARDPSTGLQGVSPKVSFFQSKSHLLSCHHITGENSSFFPPLYYFEECSLLESKLSSPKTQAGEKEKKKNT